MNQSENHTIKPKQVIIVTGGSRGIGAEVCKLIADKGYIVALNFLSDTVAAENTQQEIAAMGGESMLIQGDVSNEQDVIKLFEAASDLGTIVGLVNNAGILAGQTKVVDMDVDRIDRIFATNVRGSFICAREAIRKMARSRGGSGGAIVNVSSAAARLGSANEYVDYAASKGAIDTMTMGLSKEVAGEGIRVNAVRPGFIHTEMHASGGEPNRIERIKPTIPMGRGGDPKEVANAIVWLLSDEASYCTGAFIDLAGGR